MTAFETRQVPPRPDASAPDGSDIRLVSTALAGGSMVLCSLPPGAVTRAVYHRTVEEMWHCIAGRGRLWRMLGDGEETVDLRPGVGASIPLNARFQFRNDGPDTLQLVIATMPPWPGEDEAVACDGPWEPSL